MLILTGQTAGSELDWSCVLCFWGRYLRAAGMLGHGVMVSGHVYNHFMGGVRMRDVHGQHGGHDHFSPSHDDHD